MPYRDIKFCVSEYYHLYNRGNNFQPIFFERKNYLFFLQRLREHLTSESVELVAYCLMPNHYHVLVYLKTDELSSLMQSFGLSYTKAINTRYRRVGSLFQGPFKAVHVDRIEYLLHLSRYIHLNPVMARLVRQPEQWEFSSYLDFIGQRKGIPLKRDVVLSQFPSVDDYRQFVESYVEADKKIIQPLLLE
jgi:putative transposase